MSARCLYTVLVLLTLRTLLVEAFSCFCNVDTNTCDENTCELKDSDFHRFHCAVAVKVFNDNETVHSVNHYCLNNEFDSISCSDIPYWTPTYTDYHKCCDNKEFCNRCLVPENLTDTIKVQLQSFLDPDCNYSAPTPQPSTASLTLTLTATSPSSPTSPPPSLSRPLIYAMVGLSCVVFVCLVMAVLTVLYVWCKRCDRRKTGSIGSLPTFDDADLLEETTNMTSGSGSGQRLLEQRTIARQIKKIEIVGKGRYGEVWLGDWGGESVAVKIFTSQDEDSWNREGEVYSTYMLHHDNIAKFIACDKRPINLGVELWMVMEYHEHGSLLDYLLNHKLTKQQAQSFVFSIASGLHYLHVDIQTGAQIKPGIAHRDLKSKNILVKNDLTCCISDFGLAVRHIGSTGHVDISSINPRQGTKRYMAPEILDGTISFTKFDSYKMVDMYSFGLIMWEIARRTSYRAEDYQLPYYQYVSHDPSMEDMRKVVCVDNLRPPIESWWKNNELLSLLSSLMQECWRNNPWARLSALRVKKNLIKKGVEKFEYKNGFMNHTYA